jgi:hypothetical protein
LLITSGPVSATGVPVPADVETNPKISKLNDDPNQDLFTESERWHMAALGVDLVSSLAVTGKVITGATGELVLWQGCRSGHQHNWRCSRIRYEHVR